MLVSLQRNERISRLKCKKFWKKFKKKKKSRFFKYYFLFCKESSNVLYTCFWRTNVFYDKVLYSIWTVYPTLLPIAKNLFSKNQQRDWNSSKSRKHCKAMKTFFLLCKRIHIFVSFRQCRMIVVWQSCFLLKVSRYLCRWNTYM